MTAEGRLVPLDSMTVSYDVAGIHVIQRSNFANDAVAVNVYLLGGTRQLTAASQGIESLLLSDGAYGTARYPGPAWRAAWGLTGSQLIVEPGADWTMYGFRGIRQEFSSSWDAFTDRLMHPTLASADLAIVRARLIAQNRVASDNPDAYVLGLADSIAFAGHPYGLDPDGTESTLTALDSANLARYAAAQIVKSRMLLVVVGNVSRDQVVSAVSRTLAALPQGHYTWTLPPAPAAFNQSVNLVQRVIPTNYIVGLFRGPEASSPLSPAFRVTLALLSSRLNSTIREQRGLSYAASAAWIERGATAGAVYVSTGAPDTVIPLISNEMGYLKFMPSYVDLHGFTDQFIVEYFAENMTDEAQADFLARAQLYHGDFHKASAMMEDLR
ncbi:MAG TPA: insulinase family protein, partial [Gemmatimonadaceae bacterium]